VTSPKKTAANRLNAGRSTGPRTRAGKDRARRNALRHGLSTDLNLDSTWGPQIDRFAHALAGEQALDDVVLAAARLASAAELDVVRIRRIRSGLMAQLTPLIEETGQVNQPSIFELAREGMQAGLRGSALVALIMARLSAQPSRRLSEIFAELARIERYERRAISRRKRLFRTLDALRRPKGRV
jgi:hypothetical protein